MRTKSNVCSALSHLTVILWMPIILVFYKFASRILICGLKPPDRIEGCENLDLLKWLILLASILWISPIISILFASFMSALIKYKNRQAYQNYKKAIGFQFLSAWNFFLLHFVFALTVFLLSKSNVESLKAALTHLLTIDHLLFPLFALYQLLVASILAFQTFQGKNMNYRDTGLLICHR